jgi:hypothetical protein
MRACAGMLASISSAEILLFTIAFQHPPIGIAVWIHSPPRTTADIPRPRTDHRLVIPALFAAPPVKVLGVALAVGLAVALAWSASQDVKF